MTLLYYVIDYDIENTSANNVTKFFKLLT